MSGAAKIKAEIGVGDYFRRIFAFWTLVVFWAGAHFAVGIIGDAASGPSVAWLFGTTLCAIWAFPAFCVDALKPRPILATSASFLWVAAFGGAAALYLLVWSPRNVGFERSVVPLVYLLYAVWLARKLRNKSVYEEARRLRWAIFASVGVPTTLGTLALAGLYFSGAIANAHPGAREFLGVVGGSAFLAYWTATFVVFALIVSSDRFKNAKERDSETSEVAESGTN